MCRGVARDKYRVRLVLSEFFQFRNVYHIPATSIAFFNVVYGTYPHASPLAISLLLFWLTLCDCLPDFNVISTPYFLIFPWRYCPHSIFDTRYNRGTIPVYQGTLSTSGMHLTVLEMHISCPSTVSKYSTLVLFFPRTICYLHGFPFIECQSFTRLF